MLTIDGYSRTKGLGSGKYLKPDTFDVGGHHWFIRYYPDGNGSESTDWISIYLHSDRSDSTEVKARYGLSLLDHAGEPVPLYTMVGKVIRVFCNKNRAWGYEKFIKRKDVEESTYLKDDCFRVRCDVTVSKDIEIRTEKSSQFVTVPPSDMNQHLGHLLSSGAEADVTFLVGEETFTAHRLLLGARSSVFMAELFGPMKEKHTNHIKIDDMEPRVFKTMLHYIYTDSA